MDPGMVGGNGRATGVVDERQQGGGGGVGGFPSNGQAPAVFHNTHGEGVSEKYRAPNGRFIEIRNVWADNLEREMVVIRELVETYPYVAMDTEFPGIVARPVGDFNQPDYQYQTLRCNVDMLKMIQLGLSFANEKGELPHNGCCTWQFNFAFNLSEDMYAHDSIQLLKNSGIDFEAHGRRGIDLQHFGELLMTSGLVLLPNITWISFHSGYDFGYLLKLLTCSNLPPLETDFFDLLQLYFPKLYDIKFLVSSQNGFHGGLNKLADDLKVERIGPMHQAGSDSLLTEQVFLKVADVFFNGVENLDKGKFKGKFSGQLYGYGGNQTGIYRPGNKAQQHHTNGGGNPTQTATTTATTAITANAGGANGNGNGTTSAASTTATNSTTAASFASNTNASVTTTAAANSASASTSGSISAAAAAAASASSVSDAAGVATVGGGGNVVNSSAAASAMANPAASGDPNSGEDEATSGTAAAAAAAGGAAGDGPAAPSLLEGGAVDGIAPEGTGGAPPPS